MRVDSRAGRYGTIYKYYPRRFFDTVHVALGTNLIQDMVHNSNVVLDLQCACAFIIISFVICSPSGCVRRLT